MTADAAFKLDLSRRVDLYFSRHGVADVTWDANWNVVHIEARGLHSAESHAVLDSAMRAMTDHQGSRWLFDGRDMKAIKQSDLRWITEVWLPRALAAGLRVARACACAALSAAMPMVRIGARPFLERLEAARSALPA